MRRIPLTVHAVIELVCGLALVVLAFAGDLGGAGTVLTFAGGVLLAGLGLGASDDAPPTIHRMLDRWLVIGLALASALAAFAGDVPAAAALLAVATAQLALGAATRWTRPPVTGRA